MKILPVLIECSHKSTQDFHHGCDAFCTMRQMAFCRRLPQVRDAKLREIWDHTEFRVLEIGVFRNWHRSPEIPATESGSITVGVSCGFFPRYSRHPLSGIQVRRSFRMDPRLPMSGMTERG